MSDDPRLDVLLDVNRRRTWHAQLSRWRSLWRRLPEPWRASAFRTLYRWRPKARALVEFGASARDLEALRAPDVAELAPGPLVVSGYFGEPSGVGRGARLTMAALGAAGLRPEAHDLEAEPRGPARAQTGGVWVAHCNAPELARYLLHAATLPQAYRIAYWAWELPVAPRAWAEVAKCVHEIWTPSRFVAEALRRAGVEAYAKIDVRPHPLPPAGLADRARFGLPGDVFAFLCMYDGRSSATRKNPLGAVRAFKAAFAPTDGQVRLTVKAIAAESDPLAWRALQDELAGWPNIDLLTERLSDDETANLIASHDAFVSLHRAEGFGLAIAQAMAAGRPVIVTGWSGNMDFCQEGAGLVAFDLAPVVDAAGVYSAPGQVWAEPSLSSASSWMRKLAASPEAAFALGAAGKARLEAVLPTAYDLSDHDQWLDAAAWPRGAAAAQRVARISDSGHGRSNAHDD